MDTWSRLFFVNGPRVHVCQSVQSQKKYVLTCVKLNVTNVKILDGYEYAIGKLL